MAICSTLAERSCATLPKMPQQFLRRARADAGNILQARLNGALRAALPVKTHGEAVRFIANLLDQMKDRGVVFQPDGLILLPEDVNDFFLLGNAGDGLVDDFELFERRRGRVQLAESAVDQDQARERFLLFLQAPVAPLDGFLHAREIVVSPFAANDEFPVIGFFHPPVFPHHHRGHRVRALQVRDVEALDAPRRFRQAERLFERLDDGFRAGLQHAEALLEGVARVFLHQFQKGVFRAALRHQNFHAAARRFEMRAALGEDFLEKFAILEIHGHVNGARQIRGVEIELLQQRRQKFGGLEFRKVFPVKIAPVHDAPAAKVEQIHGHQRRLGVPREDVDVVALRRRRFFGALRFPRACAEGRGTPRPARSVRCRKPPACGIRGFPSGRARRPSRNNFVSRAASAYFSSVVESGNARPVAPANVILQAGPRVRARQVHRAGRNAERLVDEMDDPVREAVRENTARNKSSRL